MGEAKDLGDVERVVKQGETGGKDAVCDEDREEDVVIGIRFVAAALVVRAVSTYGETPLELSKENTP